MEKIFSENNIINKEYYDGIKSMVNCLICLNIIENPVQCSKCQHYFCSECINSVEEKCPLRCKNNEYIKSIPCANLLSNLKLFNSARISLGLYSGQTSFPFIVFPIIHLRA